MYEISNHFYTDNGLVKEDIDPPRPTRLFQWSQRMLYHREVLRHSLLAFWREMMDNRHFWSFMGFFFCSASKNLDYYYIVSFLFSLSLRIK